MWKASEAGMPSFPFLCPEKEPRMYRVQLPTPTSHVTQTALFTDLSSSVILPRDAVRKERKDTGDRTWFIAEDFPALPGRAPHWVMHFSGGHLGAGGTQFCFVGLGTGTRSFWGVEGPDIMEKALVEGNLPHPSGKPLRTAQVMTWQRQSAGRQ